MTRVSFSNFTLLFEFDRNRPIESRSSFADRAIVETTRMENSIERTTHSSPIEILFGRIEKADGSSVGIEPRSRLSKLLTSRVYRRQ